MMLSSMSRDGSCFWRKRRYFCRIVWLLLLNIEDSVTLFDNRLLELAWFEIMIDLDSTIWLLFDKREDDVILLVCNVASDGWAIKGETHSYIASVSSSLPPFITLVLLLSISLVAFAQAASRRSLVELWLWLWLLLLSSSSQISNTQIRRLSSNWWYCWV